MSGRRGFATASAVYATAAIILFCRRNLLTGADFFGNGGDPSFFIWVFDFLPKALAHFENPFVLKAAWAPYGFNITQATTTPLLAFLAWPITALVGPIVSYNIVCIATPALAAIACFAFARSYARTWCTSFAAGWIFGFSTAVFAPMLGHPQVSFIAFLPLSFLAVRQRAIGIISKRRFIGFLGLALICQFLTSLENFVTEAIFLGLFTLVTETTRPGGIRRLWILQADNLVVGLIVAYMAVGIVMSPFFYYFFRDYGQIPHLLQNGGAYATDLLNFVFPTPVTWLGGAFALPFARHYVGNWSEELGYIGAPLVVIAVYSIWRSRHEKQIWPLFVVLCSSLIFALGPCLHIMGRITFPLPWALAERLPFLANVLPSRLMPFVLLAISGICAYWVDHYIEKHRVFALSAIAIAAVCVLPATYVRSAMWNTPVPAAQLFTSGVFKSVISKGDNVLFLPFSFTTADPMFWQIETAGYFRMTNGYGNFVPPGLDSWPATKMLEAGAPSLDFQRQFNLFVKANGIDEFIVPVPLLPIWDAPLEGSGWHPQTFDELTVFSGPPKAQDALPNISSAQARYMFEAMHFSALRSAATCMLGKRAGQLYIASAVAAHCLSAEFVPHADDPHQNWDKIGGWFGFSGAGIGLGVTTDAVTANELVAATGAGAESIFFPYPTLFRPGAMAGKSGLLLEVFPPEKIERSR